MLSATPVNNRFNDLKNQLALAYEGHTEYIDDKLNTTKSVDEILRMHREHSTLGVNGIRQSGQQIIF